MPPDAMDPGPPKPPLEIGSVFAGYKVCALIGQGGHACVFRVHDEFLDKYFALKVLYRAGGVTPEMIKRGKSEAQFLSSLRHPCVVEVLRAGIENGLMFIVMELLEGRSLRVVQQLAGRLAVEEVLWIALQIAEGVAVAHQHKAIHRDLKPDNVFICAENRSKVLDFGIAKLVGQGGWTTQKNLIVGTMLFMSPEQVQGMPLGPESDVYALGLIMFTLLFGRHPCLLDMESVSNAELARIQVMRVPPQLDEIAPHIPKYVARLVAKALVKLPEERIRTMSEFATMIRALRERYVAEARQAGKVLQTRDLSNCDFGGDFEVSLAGRHRGIAAATDTVAVSRPVFSNLPGPGEAGGTLPLPVAERERAATAPRTAEYGSPPSGPARISVQPGPTSADKPTLLAMEGPSGHPPAPSQAPVAAGIPVRSVVFDASPRSRATPTPSPTSLGRTGSPVGAPIAEPRGFQQRLGPYKRALATAAYAGVGLGLGLAVLLAVQHRAASAPEPTARAAGFIVEPLPDAAPSAAPPSASSAASLPLSIPAASAVEPPPPVAVTNDVSSPIAAATPATRRAAPAKSARVDPVLESMKATAQRFREEAARARAKGEAPKLPFSDSEPTAKKPSRSPSPESGL